MQKRMIEFVRALRAAGVRVSLTGMTTGVEEDGQENIEIPPRAFDLHSFMSAENSLPTLEILCPDF